MSEPRTTMYTEVYMERGVGGTDRQAHSREGDMNNFSPYNMYFRFMSVRLIEFPHIMSLKLFGFQKIATLLNSCSQYRKGFHKVFHRNEKILLKLAS